MKKFLTVVFAFFISICGCSAAETTADDGAKDKVISEIGTLVNAQKYQIAMTKCNAALKKYPNESFLYYWRGSIYNSLGEKNTAIADFNKAIELNPQNTKAYVYRGTCKSELGDKEGALEDYNKAIEIDPKDSSAYSMRAVVKIELGEFSEAEKDLDMGNQLMNSKEN